jgi:hypothetical protein
MLIEIVSDTSFITGMALLVTLFADWMGWI